MTIPRMAPEGDTSIAPARQPAPAPAPAPAPTTTRTATARAATGSSASTAASTPAAGVDETVMAQQYGFALTVLNSDPELKSIFQQAVANTWTSDKFTAALRNTKWYQQHTEQWRNVQILKDTDPATYAANLAQQKSRVAAMAGELGANVSASLDSLAETAYLGGWDDNQLRANLSTYVQYTDGRMLGQAGQFEQQARQAAYDNGLTLSDQWYRDQVQRAIGGSQTVDDIKSSITEMAASAFPNLADRLRAGDTVANIADPYRQAMGSLLEIDPKSITLSDPSIKAALSGTDAKGNLVTKPLWQFQNDMRQDPRWLKTSNAQDSLMSVTHGILRNFGLAAT